MSIAEVLKSGVLTHLIYNKRLKKFGPRARTQCSFSELLLGARTQGSYSESILGVRIQNPCSGLLLRARTQISYSKLVLEASTRFSSGSQSFNPYCLARSLVIYQNKVRDTNFTSLTNADVLSTHTITVLNVTSRRSSE